MTGLQPIGAICRLRSMRTPWKQAGAAVLLAMTAAGCANASSAAPKAPVTPAAPGTATASNSGAPMWLRSLQMTSSDDGWALYYSANPASASAVHLLLARTTDGARTWTDATPAAAVPLLSTSNATQVLDAVSGEQAYLAVTGSTQESGSAVNDTEVFVTSDGGRTWTESAALRVPDVVSLLSFADAADGWLLMGGGGSMGQEPVQVYRTTDGGARWSLAAASPPQFSNATGGIPDNCDKDGLEFVSPTTGWITSTCNAGTKDALLATADGGITWTARTLPLPATACADNACFLAGPRLAGSLLYLTVESYPATRYLLVSRNLGTSWSEVPLPAGAGVYPQITFFTPQDGVLVAAGPQASFGTTFYVTDDGGQTWVPVPQGTSFGGDDLGTGGVEFVTAGTGFAWPSGASSTAMRETVDSGRTWTSFTPLLAES